MEPNQGNNPNNGKKPGGDRPKGSYFTPLMIALILVLLFKPNGMFGEKLAEKV